MKVIKPPTELDLEPHEYTIFLAGSIDQGKAIDWQTEVTNGLAGLDVTILNPRRDDWDASWVQSIDNPQFKEQVLWELDALDSADTIAMYFDPNGPAPITLLELGLYASQRNFIVCCNEPYWRKGNVDIVCERYGITQAHSLNHMIELLHETFCLARGIY